MLTVSVLLLATIVFLFQTGPANAFYWSGLEDGATVYVCEGMEMILPWDITTNSGERTLEITWLFEGRSDQMIAVFSHGVFFPSPTYSQRVQHIPTGGIRLDHATAADAGNYTVEVKIDVGHEAYHTYNRTVFGHVATVSAARRDATVDVRMQPEAVYDNQTNQFRVQLTCSSHGLQPNSVIWTDPAQQDTVSTQQVNGLPSLMLNNPVSGGNYTCRLPPDAPAAKCLPVDDPVLGGATVYVNQADARMTIMEAELKDLKREESLQIEHMLDQRTRDLQEKLSRRVVFYARLWHDALYQTGQHVIPELVYVNLGNAYSTDTGDFTAPFDGYYFFIATAGADRYSPNANNTAVLHLYVDYREMASIWTNSVDFYEMGTCTTAVRLTVGQKVWLRSYGSNVFGRGYTTFSGFLVSSD